MQTLRDGTTLPFSILLANRSSANQYIPVSNTSCKISPTYCSARYLLPASNQGAMRKLRVSRSSPNISSTSKMLTLLLGRHLRLLRLHLSPQFLQLSLLLLRICPSLELGRLIVHHYQVSAPHIEPRKMIYRPLGIINIFVHYKRSSPRVFTFLPQSNLKHCTVLSKYIIELIGGDAERQVADV